MLDNNSLTSIGFRWAADNTETMTPYGQELARRARVYSRTEAEELYKEQRNLKALMRAAGENVQGVNALLRALMPVKDIRRSIEGLRLRTLSEVELFEIKRFLLQLESIAPAVSALGVPLEGVEISSLPVALDLIDPEGLRSPSFYVSDKLSPRLSAIRRERKTIDERIRLEGLTEELSVARTRLAANEEDANAEARTALCERLRPYADRMLRYAESVGRLDFTLGKARLAEKYGAVIPRIGSEHFRLSEMTNPRLAEALAGNGRSFVPVSLELVRGSVVVTGANMGGKSVALKTLALNVRLAMSGFAVFASSAELPFIDDLCLLSEDREDAMSGLSSFGGEMRAFDKILRETEGEECCLVLLDEFARGTNPQEGAALVRAAARLFNERQNTFAVIATHFDGVARLARLHYQVAGLRGADPAAIRARISNGVSTLAEFMDYGLYPVDPEQAPPRDAITIIHALGVKKEFTDLIDI